MLRAETAHCSSAPPPPRREVCGLVRSAGQIEAAWNDSRVPNGVMHRLLVAGA